MFSRYRSKSKNQETNSKRKHTIFLGGSPSPKATSTPRNPSSACRSTTINLRWYSDCYPLQPYYEIQLLVPKKTDYGTARKDL